MDALADEPIPAVAPPSPRGRSANRSHSTRPPRAGAPLEPEPTKRNPAFSSTRREAGFSTRTLALISIAWVNENAASTIAATASLA